MEDIGLADPGARGDRVHRHRIIATRRKQLARGRKYLLFTRTLPRALAFGFFGHVPGTQGDIKTDRSVGKRGILRALATVAKRIFIPESGSGNTSPRNQVMECIA
jgi:hypothetical protein